MKLVLPCQINRKPVDYLRKSASYADALTCTPAGGKGLPPYALFCDKVELEAVEKTIIQSRPCTGDLLTIDNYRNPSPKEMRR